MPFLLKLMPKSGFINEADGGWKFLRYFDVDANNGQGYVALTSDIAYAIRFATKEEALETWRKQSTVAPMRLDGKPNRPLTAYHATIEDDTFVSTSA